MNMQFIKKLMLPIDIKELYPLTSEASAVKTERDKIIHEVFEGRSDLFLLIIGPCSADREDAVMAYMERLARVQEKVKDKILIIPRLYTGKPRSSGKGYMGLVHQPDLKSEENLYEGIISVRKLHIRVINDLGFSCADEMLYPENHRYLSDLLSYVAVGARSTEDQQHRLTASGLNIPVGFKNPRGGDLNVMIQSIAAANTPHHFIYRGWEVKSEGNPLAHAVLRGYHSLDGQNHPNYDQNHLLQTMNLFEQFQINNPAVIIDTNHANSDKNPEKQIDIAMETMTLRQSNSQLKKALKGLMIESYLEDGAQPIDGDRFGCSITDPCLGWEKSEALIYTIADHL